MKSKYLIITILLASLLNMVPALASISKTFTFSRTKMVPKIVKIGDKVIKSEKEVKNKDTVNIKLFDGEFSAEVRK